MGLGMGMGRGRWERLSEWQGCGPQRSRIEWTRMELMARERARVKAMCDGEDKESV